MAMDTEDVFDARACDFVNENKKIKVAAMFIWDGIHGRKIGYHFTDAALLLRNVYHSTLYRMVYVVAVFLYCFLAFVEMEPDGNSVYPMIYSIQRKYLFVEIGFLLLFALDVGIQYYICSWQTRRQFLTRQPWASVRGFIILLLLADTLFRIGVFFVPHGFVAIRYVRRPFRGMRPFLFITRLRNVRVIFASCLRAFRKVLVVLLLLGCLVCFWGLMGYLLFSDYSSEDQQLERGVKNDYFRTLPRSMYTMLLVHSSGSYFTEAMYPYYLLSGWTAVYFAVFIVVTNVFFVKLVIAVSYKSYKKHTESMLFKRLQKRKVALHSAFQLLSMRLEDVNEENCQLNSARNPLRHKLQSRMDSFFQTLPDKDKVSRAKWLSVMQFLRPEWQHGQSKVIFDTVDMDELGYVNLEEFYELCSLLSVQFVPVNAGLDLPPTWQRVIRRKFRKFLTYGTFWYGYEIVYVELFIGFLILLSVIQAVQVNYLALAFSSNYMWRIVGVILLCLFTLELLIKLFTFEWHGFKERPFCLLDLVIVCSGWSFYAVTAISGQEESIVYYDLALVVRVLRVIKLLNLFPPFREILWTTKLLVPLVIRLFAVFFSVMYAFTLIAQEYYGLPLQYWYLSNMNPATATITTANSAFWEEAQLNTFLQAMLTMFQVAMLSNWISIMNTVAHATKEASGTFVFFFTYRIIVSNVLMPIFIGFLVESFVTQVKTVEMDILQASAAAKADTPIHTVKEETSNVPQARSRLNSLHQFSSSSSEVFAMQLQRKTSDVNNAVFDFAQQSDIKQLQSLLDNREKELQERDFKLRRLESRVLQLQAQISM